MSDPTASLDAFFDAFCAMHPFWSCFFLRPGGHEQGDYNYETHQQNGYKKYKDRSRERKVYGSYNYSKDDSYGSSLVATVFF